MAKDIENSSSLEVPAEQLPGTFLDDVSDQTTENLLEDQIVLSPDPSLALEEESEVEYSDDPDLVYPRVLSHVGVAKIPEVIPKDDIGRMWEGLGSRPDEHSSTVIEYDFVLNLADRSTTPEIHDPEVYSARVDHLAVAYMTELLRLIDTAKVFGQATVELRIPFFQQETSVITGAFDIVESALRADLHYKVKREKGALQHTHEEAARHINPPHYQKLTVSLV